MLAGPPNARHCGPAHLSFYVWFFSLACVTYILARRCLRIHHHSVFEIARLQLAREPSHDGTWPASSLFILF
jgi:hypothetical protein